jgi:hypothetical protein
MFTDPTIRRSRAQAHTTSHPHSHADAASRRPLTEARHRWARAYRDGELVCGRVELTVSADFRLGLAPHERRYLTARFFERLDPVLRDELAELMRRRGAAARRAAERMAPVEVVFDDPRCGRQRIVGAVQPPQVRRGELCEIRFDLLPPA